MLFGENIFRIENANTHCSRITNGAGRMMDCFVHHNDVRYSYLCALFALKEQLFVTFPKYIS